ncbi:MAG: hypothetical protein IT423_12805, partial [Pirellulaceae bacterium]|nr:hypothetical protein [Pirellulaceae bacterium]
TEKGNQEQIAELKRRQQALAGQFASLQKRAAQTANQNNEKDQSQTAAASNSATITATSTAAKSTGAMTTEQARTIGEQAYLRTLNRMPNAREMQVAVTYLCSEPDPAMAVEGLIWGIVNTKEFILNH